MTYPSFEQQANSVDTPNGERPIRKIGYLSVEAVSGIGPETLGGEAEQALRAKIDALVDSDTPALPPVVNTEERPAKLITYGQSNKAPDYTINASYGKQGER